MGVSDQSEGIYVWGSFIWRIEDGQVTEVDPFHITAWGIQPVENHPREHMTWMNIAGNPNPFFKKFPDRQKAVEELDRIRNAKMRN